MKSILYALFALFLLNACATKYDTSKAIDIVSTENITADYRLKDIPFQIDEKTSVAHTENEKIQFTQKLNRFVKSVEYQDGKIFYTTSNKISIININLEKSHQNRKKYALHDIPNPFLTIHNDYAILYDEKGNFSVFNSETLANVWSGRIGITDIDFIKEKKEKGLYATLNPSKPMQAITLSSQLTCFSGTCYAISVDGELISMDLKNLSITTKQIIAKQDIILNNLYKPIIVNGNIVFATGNSEFIIFNIAKSTIIGRSSFVEQESGSIFDINLVKSIHSSENSVVISHLNGLYAFDIIHGQSLWFKNFITENILISEKYMIIFEEKIKKIICIQIQTGEIKWITPMPKSTQVSSLNIIQNIENNYTLAVVTDGKIHFLSLEDGSEYSTKDGNFSNISHTFNHNNTLYFTRKDKVYKLK